MTPVDTITVANIPLDIYKGPLGISCSGGSDSSLLLYLLMKHSSDKLHIFTTGNNDRNRYNVLVANNVIEKCIQLTGNSNIEHHSSYCKTQTPANLWPKLRTYLSDVNVIYTGLTANPPKEITDTFGIEITEPARNTGLRTTLNNDELIPNRYWCTPWTNINKKIIAEMYKELNLLDSLFPITRSCEYEANWYKHSLLMTKGVPAPGIGHCNECWWCKERKWGFNNVKRC